MNEEHTYPIEKEFIAIKRLWFAVLFQAIADLSAPLTPASKGGRGLRFSAEMWFKDTRKTCGSFIWICELFEVDPVRMRYACMKRNAIYMARDLVTRLMRDDKLKIKLLRQQASIAHKLKKANDKIRIAQAKKDKKKISATFR